MSRRVFDATAAVPTETFEQKLVRLAEAWEDARWVGDRLIVAVRPVRRRWLEWHCGLAMMAVKVVFTATSCRERHAGYSETVDVCRCPSCDYWCRRYTGF